MKFLEEKQKNKFWEMKMSADDSSSADIFIYGEITKYAWEEYGEVSSTTFKNELDELGDVGVINLYVNSPGGSVFEGVAIHNMLKRHKAKINVHIDALAASIASVIAMAGDTIYMPKNSMLMIHNAWTFGWGNAKELRKIADDLDRISNSSKQSYLQKTGDKLTDEKLQELLDAETWLSADEALEHGLCDVVEESNQMAASINEDIFSKYKNTPKSFVASKDEPEIKEITEERKRIAEQATLSSNLINDILGGM